MTVGILASGKLGYHCLKNITETLKPTFIATDKASNQIIDFATQNSIPLFIGNPRKGKLNNFLNINKLNLILSINYLFIIEEGIINRAEYVINFHGSLLPAYRGRTPHVWAIINGEKETGVTAHLIDNGCDTGDILLQEKVNIDINDTGADILQKFQELYPKIIDKVLLQYKNNELIPVPQNNENASYFGKRTPDDGEINWNWDKTRIYNWVRAQAYPYPGAFSYINGQKVIIDRVEIADIEGFDNYNNGEILEITWSGILVGVNDGGVFLSKIRNLNIINELKINSVLGSKQLHNEK